MKKSILIFLVFLLLLSLNGVFAQENNTTNSESNNIYVSNYGSDSLGNGSQSNPYQTLGYGIYKASNNSNIYLEEGIYNSTGYVIHNSLTISGINNVTINGLNGQNDQYIFDITNQGSLVLNNLNFINGYADLYGSESCFVNRGFLCVNNSSFNNFTTFMGAIKNYNSLEITNVTTSNLKYSLNGQYGEFVTNLNNCTITNSNINNIIYNNKKITVNNSYIKEFVANKDYDENIVTNYINKTEIGLMKCSYCDSLIIKNSIINFTTQAMVYSPDGYIIQYVDYSIDYSNVFADNCSFIYKIRSVGGSSFLSKFSNLTVISSYFNKNISVIGSNVNISYSTILGYIFSETDSSVNASFNWWGKNSGPTVYSLGLSNCTADYWVVMTFTCEESPISVGTNSKFTASLNHYTNGGRVWDLKNASLLNQRSVKFQVENGNFSPSFGYLTNSTFSTFLFNNTEPVMVYAIIDKQLLRLPLGTGYTTYEWYLSNSHGHDFYGDGSYGNPFKTISRAVSASLTGNKIYLFPDIYTLSWNSNLKISKNLTFFGIGNVTISRPNNRNIFIVDEKGSLTIEHINFTAVRLDYYNPIIVLNGGTLFVRDSNFYNIKTCSVIQLDSLDEVKIDNCTFKNIGGSIVRGNASMVYIYNSYFEHCSYFYCGDYDFAYCIAIKSNLYMVNATFNNNSQGSVNLNPRMFFNTYLNASIYNSTFSNNNMNFLNNIAIPDVSLGVPEWNPHIYGIIENCLFNNTKGQVASCSIINNSRFINNVATQFSEEYHHTIVYPLDLVRADLINNSYFYNNSYVSKTYKTKLITADNVYHSSFIKNKAAYGGALADPKEVHYCVFVNNSATYGGDDIFVYKGNLNCSYNWWGSNQKPNNTRVNVFLGSLTLDNWVIMSLSNNHNVITASLTSILDNNENIHIFNGILPSRIVIFSTDYGKINPQNVSLINNRGSAYLIKDGISDDFNVYGTIDNQKLSLTVYNNSTQLLMGNVLFFGNQNRYNVTLINVNGHRIFNQTLTVFVIDSNGKSESFNILTDDKGNAGFDVNYPVGFYNVEVYYKGNGYFESCNNSASINISSISTNLVSLNYTYYGKNNRFYVLLKDNSGKYLLNQTLTLTIYDSKGQVSKNNLKTSNGGRAEALLTLDCGEYKLEWNYSGNEWYGASYCESFIVVRPVNSTLILPNITFYGKGNMYNITLKDSFGTLIKGETITLIISKDNVSSEFKLKTDNYGNASITINLLPGVYKLESYYLGDEIYGEASNQGILTVLPIYTTLNFNSHVVIPENGVFTVVILDMYGRRVSGENISLELYKNGFYKIYYGISDANGEVNFRIDAVENIYFAIINYYGNIWYRESTGAATIVVSHEAVLSNIYISANDFVQYYGENKYFVISFNDSNAYSLYGKTISVSISSIDWHQSYNIISDVFGKARLQITLEPGVYNITYKYTNSYYGIFGQNSSSIVVYPMPTYVFANDVVMNIGEARYFEIRLSDVNNKGISNLPVKINVNGKSYNRTTNQKGICKFVLNLDVGKHNITYSFDNPNYVGSKGYSTVFVVDSQKTSTKLTGNDINVLNGESINYTLCLTNILGNPISASEVVLKITDFEKKIIGTYKAFSDNNGKANFNLNLTYGDYIANSYYAGNDNYLFSYSTNFIHVNPLDNMVQTVLFGRDCKFSHGDGNKYYVVLTTLNGTFIKNKEIRFIISNKSYHAITNEIGRAYLDLSFNPGLYNVVAKFVGSNNLTHSSVVNSILVSGGLVNLYSRDIIKYYLNDTQYYVALYDLNNNPLSNKSIQFNIYGMVYNKTTNNEGFACLKINLAPGFYEIIVTYKGDSLKESAVVKNNITVLSTVFGSDLVKYYRNGSQYYAKFVDKQGNLLVNKEVIFNIYGVFYNRKTDVNGVAKLNINLKSGNYIITTVNPLNGEMHSNNITVLSTVFGSDLVKYYRNGSQYYAKFYDSQGNLLTNVNVNFNIYGVFYIKKTDGNGVAKLNINLNPGSYIITAVNPLNGEMYSNNINVLSTLVGSDLSMKYLDGSKYKVKVLDFRGRPKTNVVVTFNIYGVFYNRVSDYNGIVSLNINLMPGKYIITSYYEDSRISNIITVI